MADQQPAHGVLDHRTVSITVGQDHATKQVNIVTLVDKRFAPPSAAQEWLFQANIEDLLYPSAAVNGTNGAFYRLLHRSDAGRGASMPLRRASVAANLVTEAEFEALKAMQHAQVRVFTLVRMEAMGKILSTYGYTPTTEALLHALELPRPEEWPDPPADGDQAAQDGEEGEEEEEEGESAEGGEDNEDDDDERDGSGGGAGAPTAGGSSSSHGRNGREEEEYPSTDEEPNPPHLGAQDSDNDAPADGANGKRKRVSFDVTPTLTKEFAAFQRFRTQEIRKERNGGSVVAITAAYDQQRILAFFTYLKVERNIQVRSLGVFSSPKIGAAAQGYVKFKTMSCEYSSTANVIGSLIAAARFAMAVRKARAAAGVAVSTTPLDELTALHKQCLSQRRLRDKFSTARSPKAWLEWADCQRARLSAEKALVGYSGGCSTMMLELTRDACLLTLLTAMTPDRVGVYRLLKLGGSLKRGEGDDFQIDLSEPGAHKTAAVFGPSCTTVTTRVAERISQLVDADNLVAGEYLFHGADRRAAFSPAAWTQLVKAAFLAHSGVALCPKECRSSFITWLKDGDHGDEVCRSAAKAMKHSSKVADSAAYDKRKSARVVEAAMKATEAFANQFAIA